MSYAAGTQVDHFAWWCERYLRHSVDQFAGKPLVLEDWQRELMGEALAVDEEERPYWASVALVVSRKNGKTALLSAYALYRLLNDDGSPEILLAAASDRQAGRLFDAVVAYIRQNPELAEQVHVRQYVGEIARADGGGKILRMANDPATLFGYQPSIVVVDELFAWTKPNHRRAWAALTTAGGSRRATQVFSISTAGSAHERETSILGRLIDGNEQAGQLERSPGLTVSRNHDARTLVYNYSAPTSDPHNTAALKLANPASWLDDTYLRRQASNPELTAGEVLQFHGCVWTAAAGMWIPPEAWAGCAVSGVAPDDGQDIIAGVDIGLVDDSSAVAIAWRHGDQVAVSAHVWSARPETPADVYVPGGVVDLELVEDHLRELHTRYRLRAVAYDRRFFERSAALLEREGLLMATLEQNSRAMADAYEEWHQAVVGGRVAHPDMPVLNAHVLGASAQRTERGWKVQKLQQHRKIDALVAAVMAHYTLIRNDPRSVYEDRGLLAV